MKQYTATANDEGVRLSRFVQSVTRDFPTSLLYKSFRNKRIKVNGKKGVPEDRIKAGDLIRQVTAITGGSGGGKPDSAMGGCKNLLKLDDAMAAVDDFVNEHAQD